jgi:hypothetical protein
VANLKLRTDMVNLKLRTDGRRKFEALDGRTGSNSVGRSVWNGWIGLDSGSRSKLSSGSLDNLDRSMNPIRNLNGGFPGAVGGQLAVDFLHCRQVRTLC